MVGLLIVAVVSVGCSAPEPGRNPSGDLFSPQFSGITTPMLSQDNPVVIGEGRNSVTPSGIGQVGIDATDSLCRELKNDLNTAITETLKDLREAGMPAEFMPTRSDLKKELSIALRANGCSGY